MLLRAGAPAPEEPPLLVAGFALFFAGFFFGLDCELKSVAVVAVEVIESTAAFAAAGQA